MSPAPQYLVSDFMNPKVVTVPVTATFKEVLQAMTIRSTNGVVVVNDDDTVAGILSSWDLIEHLVPDYLEFDKHLATFEAAEVFGDRAKEVANDPISEFMTDNVHSTTPDSTLMSAAALLSEFKIRQLPVVDKNNKLVGYINRTDIKRAMGEILSEISN